MKKLISLLIVLVMCVVCISVPAYAEDLDTPEEPINIDEYEIAPCSGSTTIYITGGCSLTIDIMGSISLNNNGIPISFTLNDYMYDLSCTTGNGSCVVSYSGYSIIGRYVYVYMSYSGYYTDINYNNYPISGSTSIVI